VFSRFVPQPLHHYIHKAPPPLRSGSATRKDRLRGDRSYQPLCCRTVISLLSVLVPALLSRRRSVAHKWFGSVARHRSSSKPTLRPKSRNLRMRRLFIFFWKLARLTQATFWGLPSNPGGDSRAVLHTLVGVLHSAPLGEERSERGKGIGISAVSP
jgi:hypothetical protein